MYIKSLRFRTTIVVTRDTVVLILAEICIPIIVSRICRGCAIFNSEFFGYRITSCSYPIFYSWNRARFYWTPSRPVTSIWYIEKFIVPSCSECGYWTSCLRPNVCRSIGRFYFYLVSTRRAFFSIVIQSTMPVLWFWETTTRTTWMRATLFFIITTKIRISRLHWCLTSGSTFYQINLICQPCDGDVEFQSHILSFLYF